MDLNQADLLGALVDFTIIAWVVFLITRAFLREEKKA